MVTIYPFTWRKGIRPKDKAATEEKQEETVEGGQKTRGGS